MESIALLVTPLTAPVQSVFDSLFRLLRYQLLAEFDGFYRLPQRVMRSIEPMPDELALVTMLQIMKNGAALYCIQRQLYRSWLLLLHLLHELIPCLPVGNQPI